MSQRPTTVLTRTALAVGASSLRATARIGGDAAEPGRGRPSIRSGATELAIAGAVCGAYWFGRSLTRDADAVASRNAARVIDLERTLGGFTERRLQRWAIDVPGVVEVLNRYYVGVHFPATIAFLIWVFAAHRQAYAGIRTWFVAVTAAGLVIHVLFPLAPPRMTPGFVDTLDAFGPDIYADDTSRSVANQFAAMPSLHFGWALMVAIGLGRLTRRHRRAWMAHPAITLLAIVVTGNHYWIDAAIAGVLVVTAVSCWPGGPWLAGGSTRPARASGRRAVRRSTDGVPDRNRPTARPGMAVDVDRLLVVVEGAGRVSAVDLAAGAVSPVITGIPLGAAVAPGGVPHGVVSSVDTTARSIYVTSDIDDGVYQFKR